MKRPLYWAPSLRHTYCRWSFLGTLPAQPLLSLAGLHLPHWPSNPTVRAISVSFIFMSPCLAQSRHLINTC